MTSKSHFRCMHVNHLGTLLELAGDSIFIQCRQGYTLDTESNRPEELD